MSAFVVSWNQRKLTGFDHFVCFITGFGVFAQLQINIGQHGFGRPFGGPSNLQPDFRARFVSASVRSANNQVINLVGGVSFQINIGHPLCFRYAGAHLPNFVPAGSN
jgi:hypothetical protein